MEPGARSPHVTELWMQQSSPVATAAEQLADAQKGFNLLFIDDIEGAKEACWYFPP